jgi:small subunit ribosomal protein S2
MALPSFSMRQLLEAGVHFGHQKHRWNPKMEKFIFGVRNDIHIIDLAQTVPNLHRALQMVSDTVAEGGRVLFVGTKRQAAPIVADAAKQCAQYYVNSRWLGGMLTNWQTISHSIARLRELEENQDLAGLTKKERLQRSREQERLERDLGGIKDMGNVPNLLFVIDTNKESIALNEARRLGIPVIAIADTNCDPDAVDLPIPGNDDAARAIELYCSLISKAALDGISRSSTAFGQDLGEAVDVAAEPALADEAAEEVAEAAGEEGALFDKPEGDADDLKKISGVGPVLEGKLNDLGIYTYAQIAAFTADDIAKVDERLSFKGRIERDGWLDQAAELAKSAS